MKKQETTFYKQLQNCERLDGRDNRGKRHDLAHVLIGLVLGLLRKRDGKLSSVHRSMQNLNTRLCLFLNIDNQGVISRAQLPKALEKVNLPLFEKLLFENYGATLSTEEKEWFAGDGKELRGSIKKGDKRGEVVVLFVRHDDRSILAHNYYNGTKESEIPTLRSLITKSGIISQKMTMDALHLCPETTGLIAKGNGIFLIGLKDNQVDLLQDMKDCEPFLKIVNQTVTRDKGHGRVEERSYFQYDVEGEYFAERWNETGFKSLYKVIRRCFNTKTKQESLEVEYYISNGKAEPNDHSYFEAIRKHWSVEVVNHIRDVTLQEDKFKTSIKHITRTFAGLRTLTINLLGILRPKNMIAQLELFQDDFDKLLLWLRSVNFL